MAEIPEEYLALVFTKENDIEKSKINMEGANILGHVEIKHEEYKRNQLDKG